MCPNCHISSTHFNLFFNPSLEQEVSSFALLLKFKCNYHPTSSAVSAAAAVLLTRSSSILLNLTHISCQFVVVVVVIIC